MTYTYAVDEHRQHPARDGDARRRHPAVRRHRRRDPGEHRHRPCCRARPGTTSCAATAARSTSSTPPTVTAVAAEPGSGERAVPGPQPAGDGDTTPPRSIVVNPNIELTKIGRLRRSCCSAPTARPEPVTYTFTATNTGTPAAAQPARATTTRARRRDPGWVVDDALPSTPAVYVSGDADDNVLLDPGETWTFTCPGRRRARRRSTWRRSPASRPDADGSHAGRRHGHRHRRRVRRRPASGHRHRQDGPRPRRARPDATPVRRDRTPLTPARPSTSTRSPTRATSRSPSAGRGSPDAPADDICSPLAVRGRRRGRRRPARRRRDVGVRVRDHRSTASRRQHAAGHRRRFGPRHEHGRASPASRRSSGTPVPDKAVTATDIAQVHGHRARAHARPRRRRRTSCAPDDDVTYTFVVANTGDVGLELIGPEDDKCAPLEFDRRRRQRQRPPRRCQLGRPESWTFTCTRRRGAPGATGDHRRQRGHRPRRRPARQRVRRHRHRRGARVRSGDPADQDGQRDLVPAGTTGHVRASRSTNVGTSPIAADDVLAPTILLVDVSPPAGAGVPHARRSSGGDTNGDGLLDRATGRDVDVHVLRHDHRADHERRRRRAAPAAPSSTPPLPIDVVRRRRRVRPAVHPGDRGDQDRRPDRADRRQRTGDLHLHRAQHR